MNLGNNTAKSFNSHLEALRGFAALIVVIQHSIQYSFYLAPNFRSQYLSYFRFPSHFAVLIFFVLSGYVIAISNTTPLNRNTIFSYLRKRFIRLYPIYIFSLIFSFLIADHHYSFKLIMSNLLFFQVPFGGIPLENNPIWSLNYEVLFYVLFIPVSYYRINPILISILSVFIGVGNYFVFSHSALVSSYAFGFAFWTSGLIIARYSKESNTGTNERLLIGCFFLLVSLVSLNLLLPALNAFILSVTGSKLEFAIPVDPRVDFSLFLHYWYQRAISFMDFSFWPYCVFFILFFSNRTFKLRGPIFGALVALPLVKLCIIIVAQKDHGLVEYLLPGLFYIISLLFFFINLNLLTSWCKRILSMFSWIGGISYSIYIIHFPVLYSFSYLPKYSTTLGWFLIRLFVFLMIVFFVSYILDKKYQFFVKRLLGA